MDCHLFRYQLLYKQLSFCYQLSAFSKWYCLEQTFSSLFNAATSGVKPAALCVPAVQQRVRDMRCLER